MKPRNKTKRRSQKHKDFVHTIVFFVVISSLIGGLIAYLWIYTEVDETLIVLEIQRAIEIELVDEIKSLQSKTDYLRRVDIITKKASTELSMVLANPESLAVYVEPAYINRDYD